MTKIKQHYLIAVECPNLAKHTGDTVSIILTMAAKNEQYLRFNWKPKVLLIRVLRTRDQNAGDTVSINIVLSAKINHIYNEIWRKTQILR